MSYMDILSIVLPVLAFVCVLLLLFINIYSKLRPNLFVNVNCWFCNQWTKIPKEFSNSWDCPYCEQYNGFTSDGGYNKLIPAQHDEFMNKLPSNVSISTNNKILDNGLCSTCNNNQQLKIQQLAMFSPIDDNNFDEEVEIYKEQLERAYKLCAQCDTVLNKTLQKKKSLLLGIRLKTLKQQGLDYLNLKKPYHIFSKTAMKKKFLTAIQYTTLILATIRIYEIFKNYDFSHEHLNRSLPSSLLQYILITKDFISLIHNLLSSIFVYIYYLQGIIVENCFTAASIILKNMNIILNLSEFSFVNTYFFYKFLNQTKLQTFIGLVLQVVYLKLNTKKRKRDFAKFAAWFTLMCLSNFTELNMTAKIFEVFLYSLIIILPSTKQQKNKMKIKKKSNFQSTSEKSELLDETVNKTPELLNSTFTNEFNNKFNESPKSIFGSLNNSPNSMKLFNTKSNNNENLFHVFGSQPVFENPLNTSYFKSQKSRVSSTESFCSKHDLNSSLSSSNYSENLNDSFSIPPENTSNKSTEFELNKCLNDLHLSSFSNEKRHSNGELPAAFRVSSPLLRPKPVLSPPKLQNVTQSSWVAGGYWKPNQFLNNFNGFSNLSRSSSQSSGFSSQASSQQFHNENVFNSLPSSRTNSICGEFDKYSVFSEPAYQYKTLNVSPTQTPSRFYPDLRSDQHIYICSKPVQRNGKLHENFCNNSVNNFVIPSLSPNRPSSRESIFSSTNLNLNTSFSNSSFKGNNTILRPLSVNSNSVYSEPFTKGTLLQKWREQISTDIQNL